MNKHHGVAISYVARKLLCAQPTGLPIAWLDERLTKLRETLGLTEGLGQAETPEVELSESGMKISRSKASIRTGPKLNRNANAILSPTQDH